MSRSSRNHKFTLGCNSASLLISYYLNSNLCSSYIIFLRITPFLPNWFINLVSPVIGVKLTPFWIGTFLGVAPPSFVAIQAGTTLQQLTSSTDAITIWSVAILAGFAILRYFPCKTSKSYDINLIFSCTAITKSMIKTSNEFNYTFGCLTNFICSIIPVLLRRRLKNKFD